MCITVSHVHGPLEPELDVPRRVGSPDPDLKRRYDMVTAGPCGRWIFWTFSLVLDGTAFYRTSQRDIIGFSQAEVYEFPLPLNLCAPAFLSRYRVNTVCPSGLRTLPAVVP